MKQLYLLIGTCLTICFLPFDCLAQELDTLASTVQDGVYLFPKINSDRPVPAIEWIRYYGNERDLRPLAENHVRFFEQPMGIVSEAIDVDLTTGDLIMYPPTHDNGPVRKTTMNSNCLAELKGILTSQEFQRIPTQNNKLGVDGYSEVIEADMDGSYIWKAHWVSDDPNFIGTVNHLESIFSIAWINAYKEKLGLQPLQNNQVRLIESDGRDDYMIYDIDFTAGALRYYNKDKWTERNLDTAVINQLKQMVRSTEFQSVIKEAPSRIRGDGKVIFLEFNLDDLYSRKVYSLLNRDEQLMDIISQIRNARF